MLQSTRVTVFTVSELLKITHNTDKRGHTHRHTLELRLRNKFEFLVEFIKYKGDILMISEKKIDESFSLDQYTINGFNTPFRLNAIVMVEVLCFLCRKIYQLN